MPASTEFIRRGVDPEKVRIIEAQRKRLPSGRMVYLSESERKTSPTDIEIKADYLNPISRMYRSRRTGHTRPRPRLSGSDFSPRMRRDHELW